MRQRTNYHWFFVGWHNFELFAILPAKHSLCYVPVSVFRNEIESSWLLREPSLLCLAYCSGVLLGDNNYYTQWVQLLAGLEFIILRSSAFLRTVLHGVTTQHHERRIQQA